MTDVATPLTELPTRQQDEPFIGYKAVSLRLGGGRVHIEGSWATVAVYDEAECRKYPKPDPPHVAPVVGCSCGFWALKSKPSGGAVATVELFGRVIHGKDGYQASHQRILCVEMETYCEGCVMMSDVRRHSDGLYFSPDGRAHPLCVDHGSLAVSINTALKMTPGEVAANVGTEVMWSR